MQWIYLSPHLDDVALSCGGLLWEQALAGGQVSIWTICAGDPPGELSAFAAGLHARWGSGPEAVAGRRQEDAASCAELGASHRHFAIPDCIYRQAAGSGEFLYASEESLWGALHPAESDLVDSLSFEMRQDLPAGAQVVCPLTLGDHVDHHMTRQAAEQLGRRLWYYADYPYVVSQAEELDGLRHAGWATTTWPVSEAGLAAWERSVAAHTSQISTFWTDLWAMRAALREYHRKMGGAVLWRAPE